MSIYMIKAIKKLRPTAEFSFTEEDYSTIKWDVLEGDAPTQKEIDDAIKAVKAEEKLEAQKKEAARTSLLDRLGITADEASLLLG